MEPNETTRSVGRYRSAVDGLFFHRVGIAYSEIEKDLHGGPDFLERAVRGRVEPAVFVDSLVQLCKFFTIERVRKDVAHRVPVVNRARAALIGYARRSEGWKPGTDGNIWLRADDDTAFRIRAQYSSGSSVVFAVDEVVGGDVDFDENPITASIDSWVEFEALGRAPDIDEAVRRVDRRLEETVSRAPGM